MVFLGIAAPCPSVAMRLIEGWVLATMEAGAGDS